MLRGFQKTYWFSRNSTSWAKIDRSWNSRKCFLEFQLLSNMAKLLEIRGNQYDFWNPRKIANQIGQKKKLESVQKFFSKFSEFENFEKIFRTLSNFFFDLFYWKCYGDSKKHIGFPVTPPVGPKSTEVGIPESAFWNSNFYRIWPNYWRYGETNMIFGIPVKFSIR